jgi:hypothetical protein
MDLLQKTSEIFSMLEFETDYSDYHPDKWVYSPTIVVYYANYQKIFATLNLNGNVILSAAPGWKNVCFRLTDGSQQELINTISAYIISTVVDDENVSLIVKRR